MKNWSAGEEIVRLVKKLEQEQKQIEQEIKLYMKDNETAFSDRYRISWTNVDTSRLDTKRIREECPKVYETLSGPPVPQVHGKSSSMKEDVRGWM